MMRKLICTAILVAGGIFTVYWIGASAASHRAAAVDAIGGHSEAATVQVTVGMSQSRVLALLGPPKYKSIYPKFEHKTPAQWAAIERQVQDASTQVSDIDSAPTRATIVDTTELTHRFHDVWVYQPSRLVLMTLYFDEYGTLLNIGYSPVSPWYGPDSPRF